MVMAASGSSSAAGATMKSAAQSNASSGPRGPTGPSNSQPRSSPAGNSGGSPGSVSRSNPSGSRNGGGNSGGSSGYAGGGASSTSRIGSAASAQRMSSAQASSATSSAPNAAAAKASAAYRTSSALNAGLGRDPSPISGALNTQRDIGVGGAALGSFRTVNDVAVRDYVGGGLPVSRPGSYAGPKGTSYGLNDAAWAAGGGMIADPTKVAKISGRLGYTPVGIRTNNPGNILDGPFAQSQPGYVGPVRSKNGLTYASFTRPDYGVMAKQTLLQDRYYDARGLNTVNKIIDRYAPVDVNNSAAANAGYKKALSNYLGVGPNTTLTRAQVGQLSPAMISYENAGNPYKAGVEAQQIAMSGTMGTPASQYASNVRPAVSQASGVQSASLLDTMQKSMGTFSNLFDKTDLQTPPQKTASVPSWQQSTYTGPQNVVPSWKQSGYTGPQVNTAALGSPENMVPSWQQSAYTGTPPNVPPSQREPLIDTTKTPYKVFSAFTKALGDGAIPGAGTLAMKGVDYDINRINQMTPAEQAAIKARWAQEQRTYQSGNTNEAGRNDRPAMSMPASAPSAPQVASQPSDTASANWQSDALAYGYSEAQLNDPEIRALIKELWDMGFIPKTSSA